MKRTGPLLLLVLVLVVGGAVAGHLLGRAAKAGGGKELTAIVGSEKLAFFADPEVKAVLARHGWSVRVDAAGSRQMPTRTAGYDFAFPSGRAAAGEVRRHADPKGADVVVFTSPLAVATFQPVVDLLGAAHLAVRDGAGVWRLDLRALVEANRRNLRWTDIPGNVARPVARTVLVATTRPADSNSAAAFAALLDEVTGGDLGAVAKLFTDQGAVDTTSEEPFESYLNRGADFAPMVLVYEAQFVDHANTRGLRDGQAVVYPSPTVMCEHTIVPLTDDGVAVAALLANDPDLRRLAAAHGFRTGTGAPVALADARPDPGYDTQHELLARLEEKMA